ncbi:WXG100 family type VII secretion target [Pilimelia columellifera]|uniref:ESAT-6-like protein n=1 Tax=Pilimelia columellifera subsp. columellifera TaxID=706583 RepID=A0ABN3MWM9_9ACTN
MSQTQAEAAVMAATAARFDSANDSLQGMLRRLMSELEVLQSGWRGAGGRSFHQVKEAWAADQAAMSRALTETAEAIRASGQQYTSSDSDAAQRVGASHRGVTLPL